MTQKLSKRVGARRIKLRSTCPMLKWVREDPISTTTHLAVGMWKSISSTTTRTRMQRLRSIGCGNELMEVWRQPGWTSGREKARTSEHEKIPKASHVA